MKYNISNLDQFISDKDRINSKVFEPPAQLVNKILDNRLNMIEDKIKELISPYVDTENLNMMEIASELAYKDLELKHIVHIDYEEYCIVHTTNDTKDYFLIRYNTNLKEIKSWITMSQIVRGIE